MKKFWIYKITNKVTGKIYVGQTKNLYDRLKSHKACKDKNTIIVKSIMKYGWENHFVEVLFFSENISRKEADELEVYYIKVCNSYCKKNKLGMNLTEGGYGGHTTPKMYADRNKHYHEKWLRKIGKEGIDIVYYSITGYCLGVLTGDTMQKKLSTICAADKNMVNNCKRWLEKNNWTTVARKFVVGFSDSSPYELYLLEKNRRRNHALSIQDSPKGRQNLIDYHRNIHDTPVLDLNTGVFFETISEFCKHEKRCSATIMERFQKGKYTGKYLVCKN